MLTSDLLRVRTHKLTVIPRYLDPERPQAKEKAEQLVEIFEGNPDGARGDIDACVEEAIGHGTDFLIWRGLAKLLYDRCEFQTVAEADPVEIRRALFEASNELGPVVDDEVRQSVLAAAATKLQITPEGCEQGLYADLDENQRLLSYKKLTAESLLHRYNLALAQAVLYKSTRLEVKLLNDDPNVLRYLFQSLKFFGLMHRAWRIEGGYKLEIDGPASLFSKSRKYGLQMALFLPALLLAERWEVLAELDWVKGKVHTFKLTPEQGLVSHYKARGQWISDEEKMFEERFAALSEKHGDKWRWSLERKGTIVELEAGEVLIPDYVLTHESGAQAYIEIVGFWRKSYLERRIAFMNNLQDVPLILVVGEQLKSDRGKLAALSPQIVFFKTVILVDKVIAAAQAALGLEASSEK